MPEIRTSQSLSPITLTELELNARTMDLPRHIVFKKNTKEVKLRNPGSVDTSVLGKIFHLMPNSIFLEEDASGIIIIPSESGHFVDGELMLERAYVVHGNDVPGGAGVGRSASLPQTTTFHSRTTPTQLPLPTSSAVARVNYSSLIPAMRPTQTKRQQSWKKSVMLMNVTESGQISQNVYLTLTEDTSNVPAVLDLLERQLGFEAVIYDSKWLPIQDSSGTRGKSFEYIFMTVSELVTSDIIQTKCSVGLRISSVISDYD